MHRPEVDTAIPSALAAVAAEVPDARAVVVQGRYEHVNFVVDADPLRVVVREVVPPHPAKLVDQARRIVDVTEDLRPLHLESEVVDLADLARRRPAPPLPPALSRRGQRGPRRRGVLPRRTARSPPTGPCWAASDRGRSTTGSTAATRPRVDICPKVDPAAAGPGALLTKCCLQQEELDEGVAEGPDGETTWVSVPWGASLEHVREALRRLQRSPRRGEHRRGHPPDRLPGLRPPVVDPGAGGGVLRDARAGRRWLDVLVALARVQARHGLVPAEAAEQIADAAHAEHLDLDRVADGTRTTSHSTLGLIRELQRMLPESAREHVYVGATVQDVSDTWFGLVMRDVGALVLRDVRALEATVLGLARAHRDTVMVGRTHGQPGAPITFGFKAASWADELGRHARPPPRGRPALGGRPAGRRGGCPRVPRRRRGPAGAAAGLLRRARAGRPRRVLDHQPRPRRGVRARPGPGRRDAGADRRRGLRARPPGDRRARRADHGDGGRQHHDAAQAQPRDQRAPRHPGAAGAVVGRRAARGHGRRATSATAAAGRPSGSPCPRSACSPGPRWRWRAGCSRASRSTPTRWPPTSTASATGSPPSACSRALSGRLGKHAAQALLQEVLATGEDVAAALAERGVATPERGARVDGPRRRGHRGRAWSTTSSPPGARRAP